ncbi:MAG TPA: hypothetical protein VF499_02260 [Afipia sp.]
MGWEHIGPDGEIFAPHLYPNGLYRMADPALGDVKHHAKNQLSVREDQIESYLQRGFLLRMKGDAAGKVNLIPPSEIRRV